MQSKKIRMYGGAAGLIASGLVAGGILAGSMTASAATPTPSATTSSTAAAAPTNPNPGDPSKPQRSDETLLTGDTAAKVKAAILAKYPTATITRLETDSDGVYEGHVVIDGTPTTVEVDKSYAVTGTEQMGGHR